MEAVEDALNERTNVHYARLREFLRYNRVASIKGSKYNNIVDAQFGKCYTIAGRTDERCAAPIDRFFDLVEKNRIYTETTWSALPTMHFAESQYPTFPCDRNAPFSTHPDDDAIKQCVAPISAEDSEFFTARLVEDVSWSDSCLFIDLDIYQRVPERQIAIGESTNGIYGMTQVIAHILRSKFDLSPIMVERDGIVNRIREVTFYVAYTFRPKIEPVTQHEKHGNCYKDGLHIYVYLRMSKPEKRYFLKTLSDSSYFREKFFTAPGQIINMDTCVDMNAASVPSVLYGCLRRDRHDYYRLRAFYRCCVDISGEAGIIDIKSDDRLNIRFKEVSTNEFIDEHRAQLLVKKAREDFAALMSESANTPAGALAARKKAYKHPITITPLEFNVCQELSLCYSGRLIPKRRVYIRPENLTAAESIDRHAGITESGVISESDLIGIETEISDLSRRYPEVMYIKSILDILSPMRMELHDTWKDVIFILASENFEYKPLAKYFNMLFSRKSGKRLANIESIWSSCLSSKEHDGKRTLATLYHWARTDNPTEYLTLRTKSVHMLAMSLSQEFRGDLGHSAIARILRCICENRFAFCQGVHGKDKLWYEFVASVRKNDLIDHCLYKWRCVGEPKDLEHIMETEVPRYLREVVKYFRSRASREDLPENKKYYLGIASKLETKTITNLQQSGFWTSVLRKCEGVNGFLRRGFTETLDTYDYVIGVGNGILLLYPEIRLIAQPHDYYISRYTKTRYRNFAPDDPIIIKLRGFIEDIFPEPDARQFIMEYFAQMLDARPKMACILILLGEGANGKSTLLEFVLGALGLVTENGYIAKLNTTFFTSPPPESGRPDPEKQTLKYAHGAFASETNAGACLEMTRLKDVTSGETCSSRGLFKEAEGFRVKCLFVVGTNYDPQIRGSDHGTWRRIQSYNCRTKFTTDEPNGPNERRADPKFQSEYNRDPEYLSAFLWILLGYYKTAADRGFAFPRSPTVEHSTAVYRNVNDHINKFIFKRMIPDKSAEPMTIVNLAKLYIAWYSQTISVVKKDSESLIKEIAQELSMSRLRRNNIAIINKEKCLVGMRCLSIEKPDVLDSDDKNIEIILDEIKSEPLVSPNIPIDVSYSSSGGGSAEAHHVDLPPEFADNIEVTVPDYIVARNPAPAAKDEDQQEEGIVGAGPSVAAEKEPSSEELSDANAVDADADDDDIFG